ncbi:MAG TPA: efflux RND transporter periplasmic adaptor subunit [Bryobacteraceae bacterium]|nr:efflux RND transporter periplasmic adaptor subunit [Bryobacteraceae bacterium]
MKRTVVLVLVAVGVGAAAWLVHRSFRERPSDRILLSGNIELTEINIAFKIPGKLIERMVDEGDCVTKGMLIARIDRDQLLRQHERERAGLGSNREQFEEALSAVEWQEKTLAADIDQRRADLNAYEAQYQQLLNGSRPQEILDAKAEVDNAQAEYDRAANDWKRAQMLYSHEDISALQFDQYRRNYQAAEATLRSAKERAELVVIGPRQELIDAAAAQVRRARASLQVAEANQLELRRRRQEVLARREEIKRQEAQIGVIESQIEDTMVDSPIDGVVLVKSAEIGEVLAPGSSVVTIGDIDHPWLRGYINEKDLGRVKLGAKAKVATDSYPGKIYWGMVSFISSQAEFTPKQIQTLEERVKLVYRIKIDVANPKRELKLNMPVDAEILTGPQP